VLTRAGPPDTEEGRRVAESLKSSVTAEKQSRKEGKADALAEDTEDDHLIQIIIPHTLQTHLLKEAGFVKEGKVRQGAQFWRARARRAILTAGGAAASVWAGRLVATHAVRAESAR